MKYLSHSSKCIHTLALGSFILFSFELFYFKSMYHNNVFNVAVLLQNISCIHVHEHKSGS